MVAVRCLFGVAGEVPDRCHLPLKAYIAITTPPDASAILTVDGQKSQEVVESLIRDALDSLTLT